VVAGVVEVEVVVVGVVVVVVVVVCVVVVVGVDVVVGVLVVVFAVGCWHCLTADALIAEAPWSRSVLSVALTVEGRFATWLANDADELLTDPQSPEPSALEILFSWLLSPLAWFPESSPAPPPQAAMNETANPAPPARSARGR
jgi:hypothetical protein